VRLFYYDQKYSSFTILSKLKINGNFGVFLKKKKSKDILSFLKILKQHFSNKKT
jgi:hypothetical protein